MIRRQFILLFHSALFSICLAQAPHVLKCEPPNWWTGMKMNKIQLMVYGENLNSIEAGASPAPIKITGVDKSENASYAFIDVDLTDSVKPGTYTISLTNAQGTATFQFPVLERIIPATEHLGFDASDVVYLIVPDRFANGDVSNDRLPGMPDVTDRAVPNGRHGGDLQGVINKLDYLKDLGITAVWLTPVIENNMNRASYHGYSATDLYKIDARFGSNGLYLTFVKEAHKRGLKVIMDHVNNHIGTNHSWIKNLPAKDWLNGTLASHQRPYHSKSEIDDIHTDSLVKQKVTEGWFDGMLADLNQRNANLAQYLKQNAIWWIESAGIDGIREDTYPYQDPHFREEWCKVIMDEYPNFNIVGEVWVDEPSFAAPYQRGSYIPKAIKPELPTLTDYPLYGAIKKTFEDPEGKIELVFNCLAKDFLYPRPDNLMPFLDNHDVTRMMFNLHGDVKRFTLAMMTLLTTRGIPQLFYGTEIGLLGGPDDGTLRADFPGGFPEDQRDAFTQKGRTVQENEIFTLCKQLLTLRKTHKALQTGELIHYKPNNEVYVYFRRAGSDRLMIIINHNTTLQSVSLLPFEHQLEGANRVRELITGKEYPLSGKKELVLDGMSGGVLEVIKDN